MATTTRRTIKTEKSVPVESEVDVGTSSSVVDSPAKLSTAIPNSVVAKLLLFTLAMVVGPLGSYYLTLNTIFKAKLGSNSLAGATAAVVANFVLIAYVIVAIKEDTAENEDNKKQQ